MTINCSNLYRARKKRQILVNKAIEKAKTNRRLDSPIIIHSYREVQYVSKAYIEATPVSNFIRSYSLLQQNYKNRIVENNKLIDLEDEVLAYIYRYHLKNVELRGSIVLTEYAEDIQSIIAEHFNNNLKDSFVEENYFEFKLYETVFKGLLQEMGQKLKAKLAINIENYNGFIRMEQTFYALVYPSQDKQKDNIHIEFIDSILLDKPELYMERAKKIFEKDGKNDLLSERVNANEINGIIKNYYIDVLDTYVDKSYFPEIFNNVDNLSCYFVKGYHRRYDDEQFIKKQYRNNILLLEKCFDVQYVKIRDQISVKEDNKSDYLEIYISKRQDEQIEKIKEELKLLLSSAEKIYALDKIAEGKLKNYKFRVHNVGQALATSLSLDGEYPFLYIDYGMPCGRDVRTRPVLVSMPINPGTTIILSHVHKDHWFRVADDPNAYRCNWFIPNQPRKIQLNRVIAEIIICGGTVKIIDKDIVFSRGRLTYGGVSRTKPSRMAKHIHETGNSLRLNAHDVHGRDFNILIPGDQRYDYIDSSQLNSLDLLVASHHGGAYCWSTHGVMPYARNENSTVIYSYGEGNIHGHPSKINDYVASNWKKNYHTSISGDFEIIISL